MTSYFMKTIIGQQLDEIVDNIGGSSDDDKERRDYNLSENDPSTLEARRIAEERRKAKYAKQEVEREVVRQQIRDKYNIKKKDEPSPNTKRPHLSHPTGRSTPEKKAPTPNERLQQGSYTPQPPQPQQNETVNKKDSTMFSSFVDKLRFKLPWN
ncbi:unnamed protein product [Didymodactylos carnosus]|uniref:Complexin n=1 Tax=Didymodactylos carnosus TaxID=1234261 RepID=A0A814VEV7_9BILA|nr:unnamed protein product [Didymodactylos carnosus]CAF1188035.1 unnamed protein product [Didymodactylos carnosus]CAF3507671.1 unnamed protein product [Didymodactylos carnosus]CAF3952247.1 unnamed protein product [Didymodactylos carnosus]